MKERERERELSFYVMLLHTSLHFTNNKHGLANVARNHCLAAATHDLTNNDQQTQDEDMEPTSTSPTGEPPASKGNDDQVNDDEPVNETSGSGDDTEVEEEGDENHDGIGGIMHFNNEAEDDMENDEENTANEKSNENVEVMETHNEDD